MSLWISLTGDNHFTSLLNVSAIYSGKLILSLVLLDYPFSNKTRSLDTINAAAYIEKKKMQFCLISFIRVFSMKQL